MSFANLLITKIIVPSRRPNELRRARLLDFLHESLDRKLVVVSAAAGYGKTTMLADFAHDTTLPVCWYSLDAGDRDLHLFLEYLIAAVQQRFPHFGGRTLALLGELEEKQAVDAYVGALVNDIHEQIDAVFVLVLDDYHAVETSEPVNRFLDRLLYYLPENAHLILASRTLPTQLSLARLTGQMQVGGLGTADLRFTADEIRVLIETNFGLEITPTMADELAAQSEGWITGLVLTTPTLWRGLLHEWIKGFGPGNRLFDYLATEVLTHQTPELQQFLLDTSVLAEMNVAVCNDFLGRTDTDVLVAQAEKRNLFVTRLQDHGFRYHQLLREFLRTRLQETQPARFRTLLERAALVHERRGNLDRAIDYWLEVGEFESAARLLLVVGEEYYERGRWQTLTRWLDGLSEEARRAEPLLLLWRAMLAGEQGAPETAAQNFGLALAAFAERGEVVNLARTLMAAARYEEHVAQGLTKCERALEMLPERESLLRALGYRTMGALLSRTGAWDRAMGCFQQALELAERGDHRFLRSEVETSLGTGYFQRGDRKAAEIHFQNARTYWERTGHAAKLANVLNSIAGMRYQHGDLARAQELLLEALKQAHQSGYVRVEAYVYASLGEVYRDQGGLAQALDAFSTASEMAEKIREGYLMIFGRVAAAEIWRLNGDAETAEQILRTALSAASLHDSNYEVGMVQAGLGALRLAQKDTRRAMEHLELAALLLEGVEAKRELGRVKFYLAQAAIEQRETMQAVRHLRALAALGRELDEDQFLVSDGAHAREVLDFAVKRNAGGAYFRRLLKKLDQIYEPTDETGLLTNALPSLELFALGEARVVRDGVPVPKSAWQTAKTLELFFFFALNPQGWRKEQIIENLWADAQRGQANDLFHVSVHRIRRALFQECLIFHQGLYQLNPEVVQRFDVREFEASLQEAEEGETRERQIAAWERAVTLYRGDLLDEMYADWCGARREELRERFLDALARLGRGWFEKGETGRALECYQQVLRRDPLHEATYRDLMKLQMALGNRAAAVQAFQQCTERLENELGVPPMPETVEVYRRLVLEG